MLPDKIQCNLILTGATLTMGNTTRNCIAMKRSQVTATMNDPFHYEKKADENPAFGDWSIQKWERVIVNQSENPTNHWRP